MNTSSPVDISCAKKRKREREREREKERERKREREREKERERERRTGTHGAVKHAAALSEWQTRAISFVFSSLLLHLS